MAIYNGVVDPQSLIILGDFQAFASQNLCIGFACWRCPERRNTKASRRPQGFPPKNKGGVRIPAGALKGKCHRKSAQVGLSQVEYFRIRSKSSFSHSFLVMKLPLGGIPNFQTHPTYRGWRGKPPVPQVSQETFMTIWGVFAPHYPLVSSNVAVGNPRTKWRV